MRWAWLAPRVEVNGRPDGRSITIGVALALLHAAVAAWSMALLL